MSVRWFCETCNEFAPKVVERLANVYEAVEWNEENACYEADGESCPDTSAAVPAGALCAECESELEERAVGSDV